LLAADQAALADVFAGRDPGRTRADSLAADAWTVGVTGAQLLESAAARFDCRLVRGQEAATHAILFALVLEVAPSPRNPLLHHRRRYAAPARPAARASLLNWKSGGLDRRASLRLAAGSAGVPWRSRLGG
jgi:flavin reductase (DIM6/NTAB) family NADH-FMN oxidoreductase RutF